MEKTFPLVSIIALCYNQGKYAPVTLNSIKSQTYPNIELIIVDDCSGDNTVEIIEEWIRRNNYSCTFIKNEKNLGICKSLNKGISHMTGKYFQLIACDDIMLEKKIEIQVEILEKSKPEVGAVYSDAHLIDEKGNQSGTTLLHSFGKTSDYPEGIILDELMESNFIPAMSVLMKSEIIKTIGEFDENLTFEDYDYWLRIAAKFRFCYYPEPLVMYRIHSQSTNLKITHQLSWWITYFKIFIKYPEHPSAKEKLKKIISYLYYNNYKEYETLAKEYTRQTGSGNLAIHCIRLKLPSSVYRGICRITKKNFSLFN